MKKELTKTQQVNELRELFCKQYEALYNENNYRKANKFVDKYINLIEKLIVTKDGIDAMQVLLEDENDVVRYNIASALLPIFPDKCKKILLDIKKKKTPYIAGDVEYVLLNYNEGNNYFAKFLKENGVEK